MKIEPDIKFYDTSSLLLGINKIVEQGEHFLVSSITLQELENIKNSSNKSSEIKYQAREVIRNIHNNPHCELVFHRIEYENLLNPSFQIIPDLQILSDAIFYNKSKTLGYADRIIFVTNDFYLACMANLYFGDSMIESIQVEDEAYTGFKEIAVEDESLANFYLEPNKNHFNLEVGQYLILKNLEDEVLDIKVWDGETHLSISYGSFDSKWFGKIKPIKQDPYQEIAFDSLLRNQITMLKGKMGSGKSLISLSFLMWKLEHGDIDKIIVFCNPVSAAGAAKLGFLPGDRDQKLMDSQVGNMLASKFGDLMGVEQLIQSGKLLLLPASDIRGYDTTGMKAGIYLTEAQNLDRNLMKLFLSRIGEDCICIIDGDNQNQVDMDIYSGNNNGMKRVSEIFRGCGFYGEVELQNIYRSKIAALADKL